jgi:hypothetical protein
MQDPYAYLWEEQPRPRSGLLRTVARTTCSKAVFRTECRRIFRPYTPAPERGALREEHDAFIRRNEDKSPEIRAALLQELSRFDLSDISGLEPQLNREKDALTEEKLANLERKVLGK